MDQYQKCDLTIVKVAEDDAAKIVRSRMGIKVKDFLFSLGVLQDADISSDEGNFVWPKHTVREIKDYSEMVYQYPSSESPWSLRFKALGCYKISPFENEKDAKTLVSSHSNEVKNNVDLSKSNNQILNENKQQNNRRVEKRRSSEQNSSSEKEKYSRLMEDLELSDSDDEKSSSISPKKENLPTKNSLETNCVSKKSRSKTHREERKSKKSRLIGQDEKSRHNGDKEDTHLREKMNKAFEILDNTAKLLAKKNQMIEELISPLPDVYKTMEEDCGDNHMPPQHPLEINEPMKQDVFLKKNRPVISPPNVKLQNNQIFEKSPLEVSEPIRPEVLRKSRPLISPPKVKMQIHSDTDQVSNSEKSRVHSSLKVKTHRHSDNYEKNRVFSPTKVKVAHRHSDLDQMREYPKKPQLESPFKAKIETKKKHSNSFLIRTKSFIDVKTVHDTFLEHITRLESPREISAYLKSERSSNCGLFSHNDKVESHTSGLLILPSDIQLAEKLLNFENIIESIGKTHETEEEVDDDECFGFTSKNGPMTFDGGEEDEEEYGFNGKMQVEKMIKPSTPPPAFHGMANELNEEPCEPVEDDERFDQTLSMVNQHHPMLMTSTVGINTSPMPELRKKSVTDSSIQSEIRDESVSNGINDSDQLYTLLSKMDSMAEEIENDLKKNSSASREFDIFEEKKIMAHKVWGNLGLYISATSSDYNYNGHPACEKSFTSYPYEMLSAARHLLQSAILEESTNKLRAIELYVQFNEFIDVLDKRLSRAEGKIIKRVKRYHSILAKHGTRIDESRLVGLNWASTWPYLLARIKSIILHHEYKLRQTSINEYISLIDLDSSLKAANENQSVNGTVKSDDSFSSNSSFLTFLSEPICGSDDQQEQMITKRLMQKPSNLKNCMNLLKLYHLLHSAFNKWQKAEVSSTTCLSIFNLEANRILTHAFDYHIARLTQRLSIPLSMNCRMGHLINYIDSVLLFHQRALANLTECLTNLNASTLPKITSQTNIPASNMNNAHVTISSNSHMPNDQTMGMHSKLSRSKSMPKRINSLKTTPDDSVVNATGPVPTAHVASTGHSVKNNPEQPADSIVYNPTPIVNSNCKKTSSKKDKSSLKRQSDNQYIPLKMTGSQQNHTTTSTSNNSMPSSNDKKTIPSQCKRSKSELTSLLSTTRTASPKQQQQQQQPPPAKQQSSSLDRKSNPIGKSSSTATITNASLTTSSSSVDVSAKNPLKMSAKTNSSNGRSKSSTWSKTPNISPYEDKSVISAGSKTPKKPSKHPFGNSQQNGQLDVDTAPIAPSQQISPQINSLNPVYTPTPLNDLRASSSMKSLGQNLSKNPYSAVTNNRGSKTPSYKSSNHVHQESNRYSPQNISDVASTKRKKAHESYEPSPIVKMNSNQVTSQSNNNNPPPHPPGNINNNNSSSSTAVKSVSNKTVNKQYVYNPTPKSSALANSNNNNNNNASGKIPQFFNNWLNTSVNNRR